MGTLRDIIEDYKFLKKKINVEYEVRVLNGGNEIAVLESWESNGVGYNPSQHDPRAICLIPAILRHPLKSFRCVVYYMRENPYH